MGITPLSSSLGKSDLLKSVKEILQEKLAEEDLDAGSVPTAQQASAPATLDSSSLSGVMSNNFLNRNYEKSEYTKSSLEGFQVEQSFGNKMQQLVSTLAVSYQSTVTRLEQSRLYSNSSMDPRYMAAYLENQKAGRAVQQSVTEEVTKRSKEHLDESRDEIENAAQEAAAPRDAEGNILPGFGVGSAAGSGRPEVRPVGGNITPAPPGQGMTASSGMAAEPLLPGGTPGAISLDIVV